jgi:hypothetical protein
MDDKDVKEEAGETGHVVSSGGLGVFFGHCREIYLVMRNEYPGRYWLMTRVGAETRP